MIKKHVMEKIISRTKRKLTKYFAD